MPQIKHPQLKYVQDNSFDEKFNTVQFRDFETSFTSFDKSRLEADGNNKYSIALQIDKELYLDLKKTVFTHPDTGESVKLSGLKKVDKKVRGEDGEELLDDEGDPMTEFSHYQINFTQNIGWERNGQEVTPSTFCRMVDGSAWSGQIIGFGSKVSVAAFLSFYKFNGKGGVKLNLSQVFVRELVEAGSSKSPVQAENDAWADLMGCDPSEVGLQGNTAQQQATTATTAADVNDEDDPFA